MSDRLTKLAGLQVCHWNGVASNKCSHHSAAGECGGSGRT